MRILLVEDQRDAAEILMKGLREQGYAVDLAVDGEEADFKASVSPYDLMILDVMLPRKNGFEVCRDLRSAGCEVPILILTARDAVEERIRGLDLGADDYMVKPFEYRELLARVRGLLRRRAVRRQEVLSVADLRIEVGTRKVRRAGKTIELTAKEFALLEYLARHAGEVVTRRDISRQVWDESYDAFSNLIEIYLGRLRRKIDSGHPVALLHTRRGAGYMLGATGQAPPPASFDSRS
jgi:two-component system copper resistance phosphate regulon response regulator CusR